MDLSGLSWNLQAEASEGGEGLREEVAADVSVAVGHLAKAERCATEVLARLGQSHSMARLLQGRAASVAARLPEMQACPPWLPAGWCHAVNGHVPP